MQRIALGLIALICLVVGGALYGFYYEHDSFIGFGGLLLRLGMLFALIWLAWPDLAKIPFWLVGAVLGISVALVWLGGWRALAVAIPAVLAFWLFVPRLRASPPAK